MAHNELRQALIALGEDQVQAVDVIHCVLPAVLFTEIYRRAALGEGLAVAQMVVAHHHDALLVEIPGKIVIALNVLCHAVGDLQNGPEFDFLIRDPQAGVELRFPIRGEKTEMFTICHRIGAPSVVYLHP